MVGVRAEFLVGCWIEDLSSYLTVGQRLPSAPYNEDVSGMAPGFSRTCELRQQYREPQNGGQSLV